MTERKRHVNPDAIWLYNYPSLAAQDDCAELMVWLSERDINIIWNAILNVDRFRSRVFNANNGDYYDIVTQDEFSQFQEWVSDCKINLGGYLMCNDLLSDISGNLAALVDAIGGLSMGNNSGCCGGIPGASGGTAGGGMSPADPSGQVTDDTAREGDPPPGFESWSAYDAYACDWATYILNQIKTDVATMELIDIGGRSGEALVAVLVPLLINPVGWTVLLSIAVIMIAATVEALLYSYIITNIEGNFDDYVCAMLAGDDVSSSISSFGTKVDELISADSNFNTLTGYWASSILKGLASIDSFNRLYTKQALTVPEAECDCNTTTADCLSLTDGFIDSIETAEGYDGVVHARTGGNAIPFGCSDGDVIRIECPCAVSIHIESTSSYDSTSGCLTYYVYSVMDATVQYSSNVWTDQDIPAGGGFYIFTDLPDETFDIFFTND